MWRSGFLALPGVPELPGLPELPELPELPQPLSLLLRPILLLHLHLHLHHRLPEGICD
jgi:hypothetical protein